MISTTLLPLLTILSTCLVFISVNTFSKQILKKKCSYLKEEQIENISSSLVSITQAIVIILITIIFIITRNSRLVEILIYITITSFSLELFVSNTLRKDMIIHHIITILICILVAFQIARDHHYIISDPEFIPSINYFLYGSIGLIEISSLFLYIKYILKNFAAAQSDNIILSPLPKNPDRPIERLYGASNILFILTFFIFRVIYLPFLVIINISMLVTNTFSYIMFLAFVGINMMWARLIWKKYMKDSNDS